MTKAQLKDYRYLKLDLEQLDHNSQQYVATKAACQEVERFVNSIERAKPRALMRSKYIEGEATPTWYSVARKFHISESHAKNICNAIINQKCKAVPNSTE